VIAAFLFVGDSLFVRMKRDWKQEYFYLVEPYRDKEGRPRQRSIYLGKTLILSSEEWVAVIRRVEEGPMTCVDIDIHKAVRAYCKKHGLPMKTAEVLRAAVQVFRREEEDADAEGMKRFFETQQKWRQENAEAERKRDRERREALKNMFGSSDKVPKAAGVLRVSMSASKEEVQIAFRQQARVHHPDHGGDPQQFRAVTEARDVLFRHLDTTDRESVVTR